VSDVDKKATIFDFDKVLGLSLDKIQVKEEKIPDEVKNLAEERERARREKNWQRADELRREIETRGWVVSDENEAYVLKKKND
jgi:cysteinyl-tRNA synthetase